MARAAIAASPSFGRKAPMFLCLSKIVEEEVSLLQCSQHNSDQR
jgi:hypothetical protein